MVVKAINICDLLAVCAEGVKKFPEDVCRAIFSLEYLIRYASTFSLETLQCALLVQVCLYDCQDTERWHNSNREEETIYFSTQSSLPDIWQRIIDGCVYTGEHQVCDLINVV